MTDIRNIGLPTKDWSDQQWILWYEALKGQVSKKDAQLQFKLFWEQRGKGTDANTHDLRDAMSNNGIPVSADGVIGSLEDTALGAVDAVTSGIGSILNIGKYAVIAGISLTVITVGVLLYTIASKGISTPWGGTGK